MQKPKKVSIQDGGDLADVHVIEKAKQYLNTHYSFRFNTVTLTNEFRPLETDGSYRPLEDREENTMFLKAQVQGLKIPATLFNKILKSDFIQNFNPITDYFQGLRWDGPDYIAALARTVVIETGKTEAGKLMAENWPFFLRKWLIGVVACAVKVEVKNDFCLIFVGDQGVGKTTWLNKLVPPALDGYAHSGHIAPSLTDKNTASFLAEKFLINVDDQFENIFGRDFNSMKAIISATSATIRKAYDRNHRKRPRIASFCGSVNTTDFLTDVENRRYLCILVRDIHRTAVPIDKVWAQAYELFKRGEPYYFNREQAATHSRINELFSVSSDEQQWLIKIFAPARPDDPGIEWLQKSEILSDLQSKSGLKLSSRKLGTALKRAGFRDGVSRRSDRFKSPRYLIPVLRRDTYEDDKIRRSLNEDFKKNR